MYEQQIGDQRKSTQLNYVGKGLLKNEQSYNTSKWCSWKTLHLTHKVST